MAKEVKIVWIFKWIVGDKAQYYPDGMLKASVILTTESVQRYVDAEEYLAELLNQGWSIVTATVAMGSGFIVLQRDKHGMAS